MSDLAIEPREKNAHLWDRHPDDWYVEPSWCSERLFAVENFAGGILDPACGLGRIVDAATEAGIHAIGSDIAQRADGFMHSMDFLDSETPFREMLAYGAGGEVANVVSNPPFKHADDFVKVALAITPRKVAMLLPTKWMSSAARSAWLETTPLARVYLLAPRPSMPPGPVIAAGEKPGNGTVDFAWFVWDHKHFGRPVLHWLRRAA